MRIAMQKRKVVTASIKITSLVKLYTLSLLYQRARSGYDLLRALESRLEKRVSNSAVYPFLNLLEKNGYVTSKQFPVREKKMYVLTSAGKKFFNTIINKSADLIDAVIGMRVVACSHCGCEVYKGAYEKKEHGIIRYYCCKACASASHC